LGDICKHKEIILSIADLAIKIKLLFYNIQFEVPDCHKKFLINKSDKTSCNLKNQNNLILNFENKIISELDLFHTNVAQTEIWELWETHRGDFVFYQPKEIPERFVLVSCDFSRGEIFGELIKNGNYLNYPLKHIDMVIYSNWLAEFGDLILHASGFALDGLGYAFIGESGRGKSTLVSNFTKHQGLTILGEDQVILRYLDGRFWIFGTPWHLNPEYCSPIGVPLKNLFVLDRSAAAVTYPLSPTEAMAAIMQTAFIPYYRKTKVERIMDNLDLLVREISIYTLAYELGTNILPAIINP